MKTVGLPMPRGTWLVLVVAVIPVLVSQVASAAPGYPVEDPPDTSYVVAYDPPSRVLTVTSPPTSTPASSDTASETELVGGTNPLTDDPDADTVASGVVGGPNGQVNHGQVVKKLHELIDEHNAGCLTNAVARSDLGKGDHQSSEDDVDSVLLNVDCSNKSGAEASDEAAGKSDEAPGTSDGAPGKSDRAPGKSDK
jgi:hypothetical protein